MRETVEIDAVLGHGTLTSLRRHMNTRRIPFETSETRAHRPSQ